MKKSIIITVILLVVLVVTFLVFDWGRRGSFISENNVTTTLELPISVDFPRERQEVKSPIKISGKARGSWFFEGSFPIQLVDADGNILGTSLATSTENWMTTDYIPFTSELSFEKATSTTRAVLVLSKDNPSGNPDFDQNIFVTLILKK